MSTARPLSTGPRAACVVHVNLFASWTSKAALPCAVCVEGRAELHLLCVPVSYECRGAVGHQQSRPGQHTEQRGAGEKRLDLMQPADDSWRALHRQHKTMCHNHL